MLQLSEISAMMASNFLPLYENASTTLKNMVTLINYIKILKIINLYTMLCVGVFFVKDCRVKEYIAYQV